MNALQFKSWVLFLSLPAIIAAYGMVEAETAAQPVVSTQELVKKVTSRLDKDHKSSEAEKIITVSGSLLERDTLPFISAQEVFSKAVQAGDSNYFILSIQDAEEYNKGHVPGAVNIPYNSLAKKRSLNKIPKDRKIIVVCCNGHFSNAAAMFLNQLGYEAYDMQYGTMGWNDTTEGLGPRKQYIFAMVSSQGYPTQAESRR